VDKIGVVGSFIAAACCLGLPAIVAIFTAIGLGFLIDDAVLRPFALVFLALTVAGQVFGYRAHHRPWPLFLAFASAVALYVLVFVHANAFGAYVAIAGLVLASVLNVLSRRTHQRSCER
jgi:predicted membrane protein